MRQALLWASLWLACGTAHTWAAAPSPAPIEQPRSFGYTLGDVLTQRVGLNSAVTLDSLTLPNADRVGPWLERRRPLIEKDSQGRRWLLLQYQIVNAPRDLTSTALPAVSIGAKEGPPLAVPAWPISIGPLTPGEVFGLGELQAMQPDQKASPLPTARLQHRIYGGLALLMLLASAWLLWLYWRNQRELQRLPFARAARQLALLDTKGTADGAEAWIAMHRAFNAAAGRALRAETLDDLFVRMPAFKSMQALIDEFYRSSSERFFALSPEPHAFALTDLCRQLRRIERREHRSHDA